MKLRALGVAFLLLSITATTTYAQETQAGTVAIDSSVQAYLTAFITA